MARRLLLLNPDGSRTEIPLAGERVTLGRSGLNDLSYPEDSGLSRQHLVLERQDEEWWIRDLGSKNGTSINDARIMGPVCLRPGDRITVSRVEMLYESEDEPDSAGTVVFDPSRTEERTHAALSVTLKHLLSAEDQQLSAGLGDRGTQWRDPVTALVRAGRELVARKPARELFRDILDLSMEAVGASRGVLLTLEGDRLVVQATRGEEFHISTTVRNRVMNERSSLLIRDAQADEALRGRQSIVFQRVRSLMAVPLQTDERVLGLIYVDTPSLFYEFTAQDLNLLTVMANVAAIRLERDRLAEAEHQRQIWERELQQAAEIQRQFLPGAVPEFAGLELAGYNRACRTVGGDYYDFLTYGDGKVGMALGDVAGKGMSAALLMVNLQARMRILAEFPGEPAAIVTQLNRLMADVCPPSRFISFFFCVLDAASGEMAYCNAGHNPPLLVRAGGVVEELGGGGPVLGILRGLSYENRHCRMDRGDILVLYSDGITEASSPSGEEFGPQRLIDVLLRNRHRTAEAILDAVNRAVEEFVGGAPAADDITLVVTRRAPPGGP